MANTSPDSFLHTFYFQAFGDELDVRLSDFESVRSQGGRLIGQLSDRMESEALKKQMDDVSDCLERIQHLVVEKEQMVGESYYGRAEFEVALKDCYERMEQFKGSLREADSAESLQERHRIIKVCQNVFLVSKNQKKTCVGFARIFGSAYRSSCWCQDSSCKRHLSAINLKILISDLV